MKKILTERTVPPSEPGFDATGQTSAGWRYRLLTRLLCPLLAGHALWKSFQSHDARFLLERLGFAPSTDKPVHWWHAASVGEIQTVWPLFSAVVRHCSDAHTGWLVTTTSITGRDVLQQRLSQSGMAERVQHAYFPIDTPGISQRFLARVSPATLSCVETEIWPNTFTALHKKGTPVTLINARVTRKTLDTVSPESLLARTFRPAFQHALAGACVLCRSAEDAEGYRQLGADEKRLTVVGDLKFADNRPPVCVSPLPADTLLQPYLVAASTHPGEEIDLCRQWMQQSNTGLLVIVPRHAERGQSLHRALLKSLQRDVQSNSLPKAAQALAPLRSSGGVPDAHHRLYVADTLGELHDWYAGAAAAFVGGSLIDRGGHNVLEPWFHGVPVVTGLHTENFVAAVAWLEERQGIHRVSTAAAVVETLIRLSQLSQSTIKPETLMKDNVLENYLNRLDFGPVKRTAP